MFDFLKKKLKESVEKLSKKTEEPAPPAEIPKLEERIEHPKPEIRVKPEKRVPAREEHKKPEKIHEKALPEPELPEPEPVSEKECKPGRGILGRFREKVTTRALSESDIEDFFQENENDMLEANVALEVVDFLKQRLKEKLAEKQAKRFGAKDFVREAFEDSLYEVVNQGNVNLESVIKKARSEGRPACLIFLGFNGSGKCVSGDTLIPLSDGRILTAEKLYEEYMAENQEVRIDDGFIIKPKDPPVIFTVEPEDLKSRKAKATVLWKLKKDSLVKIVLENGHWVKVTAEHPFFVLRSGKIQEVRADSVEKGEFVMIPRKLDTENVSPIGVPEILRKIAHRKLFVYSPFVEEAYKSLKRQYGTLKNAHAKLGIDASLVRFGTQWRKEGAMPSTLILQLYDSHPELRRYLKDVEIKYGRSMKRVRIPTFDEDFYEFLGLFYSEGYIRDQYVEFTNTDDFLLNRFVSLSKSIFNRRGVVKSDSREGKTHVRKVLISDKTISYLIRKILNVPMHKKGTFMEIPDFVLSAQKKYIASMIRAYWECDGHISKDRRCLESTTASRTFSMQISSLLLRFGILTTLGTKTVKGKEYYRLGIFGKDKIARFRDEIGALREKSGAKLERLIGMPSQFEKTELIPMQGQIIRILRQESGISQQGFADALGVQHSLISQYETRNVSIPSSRLCRISSVVDSNRFLSSLSTGDVRWSRVREKKNMRCNGYVYDLTVPETHNFIANNIVVHNTTSIAKLAHYLKNKGHTPVIAAADTFRAASIEQLEHHGEKLGVKIIKHQYGADSAAVVFDAVKFAKTKGYDIVLADTAGRSHADKNLMDELSKVVRVNEPDLKVLVVDSLTGNDAVEQAKTFERVAGVDAIVLTKIDVNKKGGAMLSVCYAIKKPILFLGNGQKYEDIEMFEPRRFVRELLE